MSLPNNNFIKLINNKWLYNIVYLIDDDEMTYVKFTWILDFPIIVIKSENLNTHFG